jgi:competence protein ComEA
MSRVAALLVLLLLGGLAAGAGKAIDGVVNLNTAPPEILSLLPGIGPAKVELILAYRRRRPFRTIDELVRVKGIGRRMVRALRPHLAVSGPTTAMAATAASLVRPPRPPDGAPRVAAAVTRPTPPRPPDARSASGAPHPTRPSARPAGRGGAAAIPFAARGHCLRPP